MLTLLTVNNFALIDNVELEFNTGLSCLTGETGAGKSILLGALGAVLGDRVDSAQIKHGEQRAEICAQFRIDASTKNSTFAALKALDLDADEDCILRRTITAGRSRAFINNIPVNIKTLNEIGASLVAIHGQQAHYALLKSAMQLKRVDDYGKLDAIVAKCSLAYQQLDAAQKKLQKLLQEKNSRQEKLQLLDFQLQEFNALMPSDDNWQKISAEHQLLANAQSLHDSTTRAIDELEQNDSNLLSTLNQHLLALQQAASHDERLVPITESLHSAAINIADCCRELQDYSSALIIDPNALAQVDEQLLAYHSLARKYNLQPEQLAQKHRQLLAEKQQLEQQAADSSQLETKIRQLKDAYLEIAAKLHNKRSEVATELGAKITAAMQDLSMQGGSFKIEINHQPQKFAAKGQDEVLFMVSANPGQPLQALHKVASGGELSRISLAIQIITAACETVPTMIFDEVDAGVGGAVAELVGRNLKRLSEHKQVLCVTHLPQVASQAEQQFKVLKTKYESETKTQIISLNKKQRVEEIARMLGGVTITDNTLNHAREMLKF